MSLISLTSLQYAPGFADRLNRVLDFAGFRSHGRITLIAKYSGMTVGGARLIFTQDRPPSEDNFNAIVMGLLGDIKRIKQVVIEKQQLIEFLLKNKPAPFDAPLHSHQSAAELDPINAGLVIVELHAIAAQMKINLKSPEFAAKTMLIENRLTRYCYINRPDLKSKSFKEIVKALLMLAVNTTDSSFL